MPIHPCHCPACDLPFEVVTLRISQPVDATCPGCGKPAERRFGVPAITSNSSDSAFFAGKKLGGAEFAESLPEVQDEYTRHAKEQGVSIQGKMYCPTLARFPGDPRAYISDRGDIRRIVEQEGWGCEALGIKPREAEPKRVSVGEDLVDQQLGAMIAAGKLDPHDAEKKRDEVRETITPYWKRGKDKPEKTVKRNPKPKKRSQQCAPSAT